MSANEHDNATADQAQASVFGPLPVPKIQQNIKLSKHRNIQAAVYSRILFY